MARYILAGAVLMILMGLLLWQWSRERQVNACHRAGGAWNGPASRCEPPPGRPILKREIERS